LRRPDVVGVRHFIDARLTEARFDVATTVTRGGDKLSTTVHAKRVGACR
jgi:hypothetical protein